jgi:hypothetical protein
MMTVILGVEPAGKGERLFVARERAAPTAQFCRGSRKVGPEAS